jgi:tRNA modification GTPase
MDDATIVAIATPEGRGGIGIAKVSGPDAPRLLQHTFRIPTRSGRCERVLQNPVPRKLYYGQVVDPETGLPIDEALAFYMLAPKSYTGEDLVEIQCHSGPAVLKRLVGVLLDAGARAAEPGEFTRRAFLNGRIDLSQAEAIVDLIDAETATAAGIAALQLGGALQKKTADISDDIRHICADIEADIEFGEEAGVPASPGDLEKRIAEKGFQPVCRLLDFAAERQILKDGYTISIVGRPNVGKSSLLNRLLGTERAIVTDIAGTTRDTLDEKLLLKGHQINLKDTAGIQNTLDVIERIGIRKTKEAIRDSDLILFVLDLSMRPQQEDSELFGQLDAGKVILVANKKDIALTGPPQRYERFDAVAHVAVSATEGDGISELEDIIHAAIVERIIPVCDKGDAALMVNLRHQKLLQAVRSELENAMTAAAADDSPELIAILLTAALESLDRITGAVVTPDILDDVFQRFCIGK